ncbi:MAG: hypothetical protein JSS27_10700 [Planctomycetes bacterium]|nr:hypothetical protein [Planctomycetota bacterium]
MSARFVLSGLIRALVLSVTALALTSQLAHAADEPKLLPVAAVKHDGPVDFEREVLPILKRNCLACHNATTAENSLSLETPQAILKGGDGGPSAVAGKGDASLLLVRARGGGDGIMPPAENKAGAKALTPEELGLLKLWIDGGAKGTVSSAGEKIQWQPLPASVNPIYALALSPDGEFVACNRANQVFVYQLATGREVGRLTDPDLVKSGIYKQPGVADLDLVQSLAFSPDGTLLATGGFQNVKLWKRPANVRDATVTASANLRALATTADGARWAAGTVDGTALVYERGAAAPKATLKGHAGPITALQFSADGATLVTGSADKTLRRWNIAEGKETWKLEADAPVVAVALLPTGEVASAGGSNEVQIWNPTAPADKQKVAQLKGHNAPVTALAVSGAHAGKLWSGNEKGQVIFWDVKPAKSLRQVEHGQAIVAIAVRGDGQRWASVSAQSAKLWNAADGKMLFEVRGDPRRLVDVAQRERALNVARNLVTTEKNGLAEAEKGLTAENEAIKKVAENVKKAEKELADKTAAAKKTADDLKAAEAAAAEADKAQKAAEAELAKVNEQIKQGEAKVPAAKKKSDDAAATAKKEAENKELAEAATKAKAELTDAEAALKKSKEAKTAADKTLATAQQKAKSAPDVVKKATEATKKATDAKTAAETSKRAADRAVTLAQEGKKQAEREVEAAKKAIAVAEELVKKRDGELAAAKKAATEAEKPLKAAAFSPDSTELALVDANGLITTWSAETGVPLETYTGHKAAGVALAYTGARQLVSAADGPAAIVWNTLPQWSFVRTIGAGQLADRVTALDFAPDGKLLATGSGVPSRGGELKLWNPADGKLVRTLNDAHSDTVLSIRFSPDGSRIASGAADKFLKVHNVADGKHVRSYEGHTHHVLGVSWSPDSKLLASSGADSVIKLWDVASGEQKRTIAGFTKEVTGVTFLPDGNQVLACSGDASVKIKRVNDGGDVRAFAGASDFMYAVLATGDGKTIIAGGQDSTIRVWNADNGQSIRTLAPPAPAQAQASK